MLQLIRKYFKESTYKRCITTHLHSLFKKSYAQGFMDNILYMFYVHNYDHMYHRFGSYQIIKYNKEEFCATKTMNESNETKIDIRISSSVT